MSQPYLLKRINKFKIYCADFVLNIGNKDLFFKDNYPNSISLDIDNCLYNDLRADIFSLPFKDETFDGVFASHIIEHLVEQEQAIKEVKRVLRPDGIFMAVSPLEPQGGKSEHLKPVRSEQQFLELFTDFEKEYFSNFYNPNTEFWYIGRKR